MNEFAVSVQIISETGEKTEQIEKPSFIIGRSPSTDLCLRDSTVSRRHLEVIRKDEDVYLKDLSTPNGTFIDGKKLIALEETLYSEGQQIRLGESRTLLIIEVKQISIKELEEEKPSVVEEIGETTRSISISQDATRSNVVPLQSRSTVASAPIQSKVVGGDISFQQYLEETPWDELKSELQGKREKASREIEEMKLKAKEEAERVGQDQRDEIQELKAQLRDEKLYLEKEMQDFRDWKQKQTESLKDEERTRHQELRAKEKEIEQKDRNLEE